MASLDDLLDIEGVAAAGEFTPDGQLADYKARLDVSEEIAQMTAQFCATVTMMYNTLAGSFTQLSGMNRCPSRVGRTLAERGRSPSVATGVCS